MKEGPMARRPVRIQVPQGDHVDHEVLYGPVIENGRFKIIVVFPSSQFHGQNAWCQLAPKQFHDPSIQVMQEEAAALNKTYGWIFQKKVEDNFLYLNEELGCSPSERLSEHLIEEFFIFFVLPTEITR